MDGGDALKADFPGNKIGLDFVADSPRAIDLHAHLAREDPAAPPFLRHLFDVEGYLALQAQAGIGLTVLSYALTDPAGEGGDLDGAKAEHEFLQGLATRYAGASRRWPPSIHSVVPAGSRKPGRALDAGFVGLCFPTSRNGRYLDADAAQDAFAFAEERRAVILLHPSDPAISLDAAGDFIVRDWIGRPYDTGICLSRLLLAGHALALSVGARRGRALRRPAADADRPAGRRLRDA